MPISTNSDPSAKPRCRWATREPSLSYHDQEWGVPVHDDRTWFEFITLEGAQAGLSWETVLKKRDRYRKVFSNFDPKKVARYDAKKKKSLLADAGIIRNRLKVDSTITNAQAFLKIQKEFGSFDNYIWKFVDGKPLQSKSRSQQQNDRQHRNLRRHQQRSQEARLPLRRHHDHLRADASHRLGQRSHQRLLSFRNTESLI